MISGARSPATSGCSRSDRVNGRRRMVAAVWAAALAVGAVLTPHPAAAAGLHGVRLDWPWALPFAGLLLSIATGPLLFPRIWHGHYGKIAFMWSALTLVPLAALHGFPVAVAGLVHAMLAEYLSFIVLLFALYVVAGGILVTGNLRGTPWVNAAILGLGTLMASVVGTTGAAGECSCGGILHFSGRQYWGRPVAARRSPAVHRLPARRRFLLDHPPSRLRDRAHGGNRARSLRRDRYLVLSQGPPHRARRRAGCPLCDRCQGQDQYRADRADHRRDPRLGDLEAGRHVRCLWHGARAGKSRPRRCAHRHRAGFRSEEHTSELQSLAYLVCRL